MKKLFTVLSIIWLVVPFLIAGPDSGTTVCRTGGLIPAAPGVVSEVTVEAAGLFFQFTVNDERADTLLLRILDRQNRVVWDSGWRAVRVLSWEAPRFGGEQYFYELSARGRDGQFAGAQTGLIDLQPENQPAPAVTPLSFNVNGNFTISQYLGVGISTPERAVHVRGSNAVFRMDRSVDSAAFMLVRTDSAGQPLKTYVVGVNAEGPGDGSLVINDLGTATTGPGTNRLTIDNTGTAVFGGDVQATAFTTPSSLALKTDIRPLVDAPGLVEKLRGVRFNWKATGQPAIGFIAEEVAPVLPEVVALDGVGNPAGIDYGKLTVLLVEASKSQQRQIEELRCECTRLEAEWEKQLVALKARLGKKP